MLMNLDVLFSAIPDTLVPKCPLSGSSWNLDRESSERRRRVSGAVWAR